MANHAEMLVTDELFSLIVHLWTVYHMYELISVVSYTENTQKRVIVVKMWIGFVLHFLCQFPCLVQVSFSEEK